MTDNERHPGWKRMRFKGNKVWMAVGDNEKPLVEKGKVLIKYQLDQPHQYQVLLQHIHPLAAESNGSPAEAAETRGPSAVKRPRPAGMAAAAGKALEKEALPPNAIHIYTDGACSGNPGPAGIGIVMIYQGHRKEISRYIGMATNNIAELEAIRTALEAVKNRQMPVILHSDSSYALGLLTQGWKPKQNQALVQQLRALANGFKALHFVKVKGHAGHPENERADQLAVEAIQSGKA